MEFNQQSAVQRSFLRALQMLLLIGIIPYETERYGTGPSLVRHSEVQSRPRGCCKWLVQADLEHGIIDCRRKGPLS